MKCISCGKNVDISYGEAVCPFCGEFLSIKNQKKFINEQNMPKDENKSKDVLKKGIVGAASVAAGVGSLYSFDKISNLYNQESDTSNDLAQSNNDKNNIVNNQEEFQDNLENYDKVEEYPELNNKDENFDFTNTNNSQSTNNANDDSSQNKPKPTPSNKPNNSGNTTVSVSQDTDDDSSSNSENSENTTTPGSQDNGNGSSSNPEDSENTTTPGSQDNGNGSSSNPENSENTTTPGSQDNGNGSSSNPEDSGNTTTPGSQDNGNGSSSNPEDSGNTTTPDQDDESNSSSNPDDSNGSSQDDNGNTDDGNSGDYDEGFAYINTNDSGGGYNAGSSNEMSVNYAMLEYAISKLRDTRAAESLSKAADQLDISGLDLTTDIDGAKGIIHECVGASHSQVPSDKIRSNLINTRNQFMNMDPDYDLSLKYQQYTYLDYISQLEDWGSDEFLEKREKLEEDVNNLIKSEEANKNSAKKSEFLEKYKENIKLKSEELDNFYEDLVQREFAEKAFSYAEERRNEPSLPENEEYEEFINSTIEELEEKNREANEENFVENYKRRARELRENKEKGINTDFTDERDYSNLDDYSLSLLTFCYSYKFSVADYAYTSSFLNYGNNSNIEDKIKKLENMLYTGRQYNETTGLFTELSKGDINDIKSQITGLQNQIVTNETVDQYYENMQNYQKKFYDTKAEGIFRLPEKERSTIDNDFLLERKDFLYSLKQQDLSKAISSNNDKIEELTNRKEELESQGALNLISSTPGIVDSCVLAFNTGVGILGLTEEEKKEYDNIVKQLSSLAARNTGMLEDSNMYESIKELLVTQRSDFEKYCSLSNITVEKNTILVDTFSGSTTTEYVFKDKNNQVLNLTDEEKALILASKGQTASIDSKHAEQINKYINYLSKNNEEALDILAYNFNKSKIYEGYDESFISSFNHYFDQGAREIGKEKAESVTKWLDTHTADWLTLSAVGVADGVTGFFRGLGNLFSADGRADANDYKGMFIADYVENSGNYNKFYSQILTADYEIMNSIGNMLPSIALSVACAPLGSAAAIISTTSMGLSAAGNAREQALQSGMTQGQAWVYGILSGASEAVLERFLGGIPGLSNMSNTIGKHGLSKLISAGLGEASEEMLQEILDPVFKYITTGQWEGISWENVAKAGIYAFITAGIMNGGSVTIEGVSHVLTGDYLTISTLANMHGVNAMNSLVTGQKVDIKGFINDLELVNNMDLSEIKSKLASNEAIRNIYDEVISKDNSEMSYDDYVSQLAIQGSVLEGQSNPNIVQLTEKINQLQKELSDLKKNNANQDQINMKNQEIKEAVESRKKLHSNDLAYLLATNLATNGDNVTVNTETEENQNEAKRIDENNTESNQLNLEEVQKALFKDDHFLNEGYVEQLAKNGEIGAQLQKMLRTFTGKSLTNSDISYIRALVSKIINSQTEVNTSTNVTTETQTANDTTGIQQENQVEQTKSTEEIQKAKEAENKPKFEIFENTEGGSVTDESVIEEVESMNKATPKSETSPQETNQNEDVLREYNSSNKYEFKINEAEERKGNLTILNQNEIDTSNLHLVDEITSKYKFIISEARSEILRRKISFADISSETKLKSLSELNKLMEIMFASESEFIEFYGNTTALKNILDFDEFKKLFNPTGILVEEDNINQIENNITTEQAANNTYEVNNQEVINQSEELQQKTDGNEKILEELQERLKENQDINEFEVNEAQAKEESDILKDTLEQEQNTKQNLARETISRILPENILSENSSIDTLIDGLGQLSIEDIDTLIENREYLEKTELGKYLQTAMDLYTKGLELAQTEFKEFFQNFRDHGFKHALEVTKYAMNLSKGMNIDGIEMEIILYSALCHDFGMRGGQTVFDLTLKNKLYDNIKDNNNLKPESINKIKEILGEDNSLIVLDNMQIRELLADGIFSINDFTEIFVSQAKDGQVVLSTDLIQEIYNNMKSKGIEIEDGNIIKNESIYTDEFVKKLMSTLKVDESIKIDELQKLIAKGFIDNKKFIMDYARSSHPLNSALDILENSNLLPKSLNKVLDIIPEEIKSKLTEEENQNLAASIVAVIAMSHSKSTSGITYFNLPSQWIECIEKLQKAAEFRNMQNVNFDCLKDIVNNPELFVMLQNIATAVRDGDAMSKVVGHNTTETIMQDGGVGTIDISEATGIENIIENGLDVISEKEERKRIKDTVVYSDGSTRTVEDDFSRGIHVGEQNVVFDSLIKTEENLKKYIAEVNIINVYSSPNSTISTIEERLGEIRTYSHLDSREFVIHMPSDTDPRIIQFYENEIKKWCDKQRGIDREKLTVLIKKNIISQSQFNEIMSKQKAFYSNIKIQFDAEIQIESDLQTRIDVNEQIMELAQERLNETQERINEYGITEEQAQRILQKLANDLQTEEKNDNKNQDLINDLKKKLKEASEKYNTFVKLRELQSQIKVIQEQNTRLQEKIENSRTEINGKVEEKPKFEIFEDTEGGSVTDQSVIEEVELMGKNNSELSEEELDQVTAAMPNVEVEAPKIDITSIPSVVNSDINFQISNLEITLSDIKNIVIQDVSSITNNIMERLKSINDLVSQKLKSFTTEQKNSIINKLNTFKQNFIDGASTIKTSMRETYDSIINSFNNLIENIKSKKVEEIDAQKQEYFNQITTAIEYMNKNSEIENNGYIQLASSILFYDFNNIPESFRNIIKVIPRNVLIDYFGVENLDSYRQAYFNEKYEEFSKHIGEARLLDNNYDEKAVDESLKELERNTKKHAEEQLKKQLDDIEKQKAWEREDKKLRPMYYEFRDYVYDKINGRIEGDISNQLESISPQNQFQVIEKQIADLLDGLSDVNKYIPNYFAVCNELMNLRSKTNINGQELFDYYNNTHLKEALPFDLYMKLFTIKSKPRFEIFEDIEGGSVTEQSVIEEVESMSKNNSELSEEELDQVTAGTPQQETNQNNSEELQKEIEEAQKELGKTKKLNKNSEEKPRFEIFEDIEGGAVTEQSVIEEVESMSKNNSELSEEELEQVTAGTPQQETNQNNSEELQKEIEEAQKELGKTKKLNKNSEEKPRFEIFEDIEGGSVTDQSVIEEVESMGKNNDVFELFEEDLNNVQAAMPNIDMRIATETSKIDISSIQNVVVSNIDSQISSLADTLNNIKNGVVQNVSMFTNNIMERLKSINDLVSQKLKSFTTEQKASFINKLSEFKQNFIDGADMLKTSMKENYNSIINSFNNLIEKIKSKEVIDLDAQKQAYFDQITNAIEYMNSRFIAKGENLGYSHMSAYLQTENPEYISRAYRDVITAIPKEVIYEYFDIPQVNNNQSIMSYPQLRNQQIQDIQSYMNYMANVRLSNFYGNYIKYRVQDFDVASIRGFLEQRYANAYNLFIKYWDNNGGDYFMNFEIGEEPPMPFRNSYKIYVPFDAQSYNNTVIDVFDYLINNNIASNNKISKTARADGIVLRIYDYHDAMKVIDFINSNPNIPSNVQGIPLAMRYGKVSLAMDGNLSYNSVVTDLLQRYMQTSNIYTIAGFKNYISDLLYRINVLGDAKLLQETFGYGSIESYTNKLQVLKLLEYSLDENTTIEEFMGYCRSNQDVSNVEKQVENVRNILAGNA